MKCQIWEGGDYHVLSQDCQPVLFAGLNIMSDCWMMKGVEKVYTDRLRLPDSIRQPDYSNPGQSRLPEVN